MKKSKQTKSKAKKSPDHRDAQLVLRLYDLRRESVMRASRDKIAKFLPRSYDDLVAITKPEHPDNAAWRQVSSYFEMAYGFARHGIAHPDFLAENTGEGMLLFAKIAPYLERFRLTPEMDGSLPAEVRITRFTDGLALETEVSLEGKVVARSWTAATARVFRAGVQVPSPQPWTLNNPRLYDVTFTLKKGEETLDRVRSYTGFRKAAVENGRFTFNGARKHQKVEDPRFLYWADKMGLLVSGEAANSYQSWGGPNPGDPRQQAHLRGLYQLTKSLDPTRPVIDNEGWQHTGTTNLFAVQDYGKDFETLNSRRQRFVKTGKLPPHGTPYLAPGQAYNGTPLYLSEFGGIACIPEGANVPQGSWGNSGVEKPVQAALDRLHGQYQAIAAKPFMGICYTQLTDVEQEVNGLLTYDRKPKFPSEEPRKINGLLQ